MTRSVVVEPEIQAISDKFIAAFKKGDAQGITDLFAKDAVLLPNHAPRLKGQQAIAAHWKAGLEQLSTLKLTTTDVIPLGIGCSCPHWYMGSYYKRRHAHDFLRQGLGPLPKGRRRLENRGRHLEHGSGVSHQSKMASSWGRSGTGF